MVRRVVQRVAIAHRPDGRGRHSTAPPVSGRKRVMVWSLIGLGVVLLAAVTWVGVRGVIAKGDLEAAIPLAQTIKDQLLANEPEKAAAELANLQAHTDTAVALTGDPVWRVAELFPVLGSNLTAFREASEIVGTVSSDALEPVVELAGTIDISSFKPVNGQVDLQPIIDATVSVELADDIVAEQLAKAMAIDVSLTIQPVGDAVAQLQETLADASATLGSVRTAVNLLPGMLGADGPRDYLLMFQNNAETRALGGNPASLALVHVDDGRVDLTQQASSGDLSSGVQPIPLDPELVAFYEKDLGATAVTGAIQNITMIPDFPTVAVLAQALWERQFGLKVDGVVSLDPVALSYMLGAAGEVTLANGDVLTEENVVKALLSDVYARFGNPADQDAYFEDAARAVFDLVKSGQGESKDLLKAFARAVDEGRLIVWSDNTAEQAVIETTDFSGILPTDNDLKTVVGVFTNAFSTSKLQYYMDAVVGVDAQVCNPEGFTTTATLTITSTVPPDAATTLTAYVLGSFGGVHSLEALVLGPIGATFTSAEGGTISATGIDKGRPAARVAFRVAPGETKTVTVVMTSPAGDYGPLEVRTTPLVTPTVVNVTDTPCG